MATILVGFVQLVSNIATLFVVDKVGRKPLLIISAILMCLSMGSMGSAFYLKQQNIDSFGCVLCKQKNKIIKFIAGIFDRIQCQQVASFDESGGLHDWILNWFRLHSVSVTWRIVSIKTAKCSEFDCRII